MRRIIERLVALPIFLLGIGGGNGLELDSEERGASVDESWACDGPRADLSLTAWARGVGDRTRITLEFENRTEFPVNMIRLGVGGRYEWGGDPNEPLPVANSVLAPEGWSGRFGRQFEGVMMKISWSARKREDSVPPGGQLRGLSFEVQKGILPPANLPFEAIARGPGCLWNRWTLELDSVESEH